VHAIAVAAINSAVCPGGPSADDTVKSIELGKRLS
jgi:hypothetical protein